MVGSAQAHRPAVDGPGPGPLSGRAPGTLGAEGSEPLWSKVYFLAFALAATFLVGALAALRGVSMAAWAAARRAMGTRNGLQLT